MVRTSMQGGKSHEQSKKIGLLGYMYILENYYYVMSNDKLKQPLYTINNTLEKIVDYKSDSVIKKKILTDLENNHLPTICKIINEYNRIQGNLPDNDAKDNFMNEVSSFLEQMKLSFDKQLNAMLSDNIQEVKIEMKYINMLLKSGGFLDDGFKYSKKN